MKNFKIGDEVIFRNIFSLLSGRISKCHKWGYSIKTVDSAFTIVTYEVSVNDVIRTVRSLDENEIE